MFPSFIPSSTPEKTIFCGIFQFSGVNVIVEEEIILTSVSSGLLILNTTWPSGFEDNNIGNVEVAVDPSLIVKFVVETTNEEAPTSIWAGLE